MLKRENSINQICEEVVEFLSEYIHVDNILLFGSYAVNNAREDSDFDIAVISDDLKNMEILQKLELFSKVALMIDSRLELKGFSVSEFNSPEKGSFLEEIKKYGKLIYSSAA